MNVNTILDLAREQTYVENEGKFTNDNLIKYLNIVYHDMENEIIRRVDEDFFYEVFDTDVVAGQNEYTFEDSSATNTGMKKLLDLSIIRETPEGDAWTPSTSYSAGDTVIYINSKYTAKDDHTSGTSFDNSKWNRRTFYKKLNNIDTEISDYSRDYLRSETNKENGIREIKDSSVFIYPTPENDVTSGLKVAAVINQIDLVVDGTEDTIFPDHSELRQYHYLLALGMKEYIYQIRGLINEKNDARQEYQEEKQVLMEYLTDRYNSPTEGFLLNWTNLAN